MRIPSLLIFITVLVTNISVALAAKPIPADSMGLSKVSVFDTPPVKVYNYKGGQPGEDKVLPRAFLNAPPQIPHAITDFLPITAQNNMCIACHNQPGNWDAKREKGMPTPIPRSHYTDLRNAPDKVTDHLINSRYNCNQCHVPQADASPLVENTFDAKAKR